MAQITIDFTAPQATRAAAALGSYLNLKDAQGVARVATQAEVKDWLIKQLRGLVVSQERRAAEAALASPVAFDPT